MALVCVVVVVPQDEISTIIKSYGNCQLVRGKCLNGGGIVAPAPTTGRAGGGCGPVASVERRYMVMHVCAIASTTNLQLCPFLGTAHFLFKLILTG